MMIRMWGTLRPLSPLPPSQKDRGSSCPVSVVGKPQTLLPTCAVFISTDGLLYRLVGKTNPPPPLDRTKERGFLAPLPLEQIPGLSHIQAAAKGGEHVSTHTHPSPDTHHPQGQHGTTRGGQNLNKVGPKSRDLRKLHSKVKRGNYVPKDNTCYKLSRNQNRKPTPLPPVPFCFYLTE